VSTSTSLAINYIAVEKQFLYNFSDLALDALGTTNSCYRSLLDQNNAIKVIRNEYPHNKKLWFIWASWTLWRQAWVITSKHCKNKKIKSYYTITYLTYLSGGKFKQNSILTNTKRPYKKATDCISTLQASLWPWNIFPYLLLLTALS
jgi:hypothetical protein